MTFAIAAAGTGGHVLPGLAVADALQQRGVASDEISFIGGDRVEATMVPEAGYQFTPYRLARLERRLALSNLRIPATVRRSAKEMAADLRASGTRVVLGMSGYVVVPASRAARSVGASFFLQEQNAEPGLASRIAARKADRVFVGLPGQAERMPRSVVTGNPLRRAFETFDRTALRPLAIARYGISEHGPVVGVVGGSLGAKVLNEAAASVAAAPGVGTLLHLTGPTAEAQVPVGDDHDARRWIRVETETHMELFYAVCDLVVCRAGGSTVSELAATATPSVLVPLERVGQMANASGLVDADGAVLLAERDIGGIGDIVAGVLADHARLQQMATGAASRAMPDAAGVIADALIGAADGAARD